MSRSELPSQDPRSIDIGNRGGVEAHIRINSEGMDRLTPRNVPPEVLIQNSVDF